MVMVMGCGARRFSGAICNLRNASGGRAVRKTARPMR